MRPTPVGVTLPSGKHIDAEIQTDILNLMNRMVGDGRYGGLIRGQGTEVSAIVRNFQQQSDVITPWLRENILEYLDAFAQSPSPGLNRIRQAFTRFDQGRSELLPHIGVLCTQPLPFAAAQETRPLLRPVVDAYQELLAAIRSSYAELFEEWGDDARALIEQIMLIDTVFSGDIDSPGGNADTFVALLTPLHPLLLWHYFEYATVISEQREQLSEKDRALVRSELKLHGVPFFLTSIGVPRIISGNASFSLTYAGKYAELPYFSERATVPDPKDGLKPISKLIEAFISLYPSAAEGLRLALLDPPADAASTFLPLFCDFADAGRLRGAHVTILRRKHGTGPNSISTRMRNGGSSSGSATMPTAGSPSRPSTWHLAPWDPRTGACPTSWSPSTRASAIRPMPAPRAARSSRSRTATASSTGSAPGTLTWSRPSAGSSPTTRSSRNSQGARTSSPTPPSTSHANCGTAWPTAPPRFPGT